jgi:hypothetical protein
MPIVGMMQMARDEIVDMVAMRHRRVTAAGSVDMSLVMRPTLVVRGAGGRINRAHLERALVHVPRVGVVQMAIVQVVDMVAVLDGGVPTVGSVLMVMVRVGLVAHDSSFRGAGHDGRSFTSSVVEMKYQMDRHRVKPRAGTVRIELPASRRQPRRFEPGITDLVRQAQTDRMASPDVRIYWPPREVVGGEPPVKLSLSRG